MAQAFETLRLLIAPGRSRRARRSHRSRVNLLNPLSSAPSTSASGRDSVSSVSGFRLGIEPDPPIAHVPHLGERPRQVGDAANRHVLEPAGSRLRQRAGELGRVALGRDKRVDGEGGGGAQNRADIVRVGDLVKNQHQSVRGQIRDVDRRERPRLEQEPLMNRFAGRAGGNLLRPMILVSSPRAAISPLKPLGRGGRGVETDKLAPRGFERRRDAVKAVDERNLRLPPLARTIAWARVLGGRSALAPGLSSAGGGGRRIARSEGRRT